MAKRSRTGGDGVGLAAGVDAGEKESEACKACRQRRRHSSTSGGNHNHLSRLGHDLVLEIAARLPSPSDARSLALASAELYSAIRPALSSIPFLAGYLRRRGGVPGAPPGFFLSTGSKTVRRRSRRRDGPPPPAPDTVFVRGPRHILRGYNVVDPATFRAFLATARRRRAHVVASSGHLLLCAHGDAAGGARYSVVDPTTDVWISLPPPPPPPGIEEASAAYYAGCPAFHCAAGGTELTVAYLARRRCCRRHDAHLAVHWFISTSGRWRSTPTAARGDLRPAAAAASVGGTFYWMMLVDDDDAAGGCANAGAGKWPPPEHSRPCAVVAWDKNTTKIWNVPCPLRRGLAMLREAGGLLRYCHTTRYPYPYYRTHCHDQKLDGARLDVWTLEAAAAGLAAKWQLRILGAGDSAAAHADEAPDAEFWTWVLYNNVQAGVTCGYRAEDVVAGHAYDVFRYSPDLAG